MFKGRFLLFSLVLTFFLPSTITGQEKARVEGVVKKEDGQPLSSANVSVAELQKGTITETDGSFSVSVPSGETLHFIFSFVGYEKEKLELYLSPGEVRTVEVVLVKKIHEIQEISIRDRKLRQVPSLHKINPETIHLIPNTSGGVEAIIKTLPGVVSNNELSTQYSVRGGNFDENLIYVNDYEIYRPFLVRSGQQEGLSFLNPDMVGSVVFSSGGFEAQYGDKLSSVLDVRYKNPDSLKGSVAGSLLGGSAHLEGVGMERRLNYLFGVRQKSNRYLLNSLNTKGSYRPSFTDIQGYVSFQATPQWEFEALANYNRNIFRFTPDSQVTTSGLVNQVLRLRVFFDGEEQDRFVTSFGGAGAIFRPSEKTRLKIYASAFQSVEEESFDLIGQYWLDEIESDLGSEDFGQTKFSLGAGTFHNWARNRLVARVGNVGHKGSHATGEHYLEWGGRWQRKVITDRISEWVRVDSAGYSIPFSDEEVRLKSLLKSDINLETNRFEMYLQDNWDMGSPGGGDVTVGGRLTFSDLNKELLFSPRAHYSYQPEWETDILFRVSSGIYSQPPFYREMRDFEGNVNTDLKAQKSAHFVTGTDLNFEMWGRPFKFISEIYYKHMWDLVPYEIDNVRIRYFGNNNSRGYAAGIDLRLHGEFVENAESWVSLSLMQTREDLTDDFYYEYFDSTGTRVNPATSENPVVDSNRVEPGYIPRPTDQRLNFSLFFQDYLPMNENYKMHLNLLFGTGLPFGPPDHQRYKDVLRIPPYRRVDIGFSMQLMERGKNLHPKSAFRHFESMWFSLEVFNILGVSNTVSYLWVKDIRNRVYAIPNHLTNRRINGKIIARF